MKRELLSGNEAVARGAFEGGVKVACGYPGTPATEIIEHIAEYEEIYAEWSPNEKVAFEVGIGASIAGARALVAMKQVGLNVAADPLFTFSYTGVNGGFVAVSADDPELHSSQNEQDSRHYAKAAKVPMLEPAHSQEAKDFVIKALEISEEFDTPVLLRSTTRVSHTKSLVSLGEPMAPKIIPYKKDEKKFVMIPAHARKRHEFIEERLKRLAAFSESFPFNRVEKGSPKLGIIASGAAYLYAREVFPGASFLKLSFTYPLPRRLIREFASQVKRLFVVEELDPFLEDGIRAIGVEVSGKDFIPTVGELNPKIVYEAVAKAYPAAKSLAREGLPSSQIRSRAGAGRASEAKLLPNRPPVMCPGCPHRSIFYVLNKLKLIVNGDIGCYTLAVLPPLSAMDTQLCMGTGASVVHGFEKASPDLAKKAVGVIGDSTFVHSGIAPLIDIVYNRGSSTVIILDNRTTAMTGKQDHPGTGVTLKGEKSTALNFEKLARAIGVKSIRVVDPYDLGEVEQVIREETAKHEPSLIVSRRACLLVESIWELPYEILTESCRDCGLCLRLGCPAISQAEGVLKIDQNLCIGCAVCLQVCKLSAIKQAEAR